MTPPKIKNQASFKGGDYPAGGPEENRSATKPLRTLLGPLVSPLLRRPDGSLDLGPFPKGSYEDFHRFLLTQVRLDGIAFNQFIFASYEKVLSKEEYRPLLEGLYREISQSPSSHAARGEGGEEEKDATLLSRLTAEIIDVSAQRFVSAHLDSPEGRSRIRGVLFGKDHFSPGTRSNLAKAIAQVGYEKGASWKKFVRFNRELPWFDYFNLTSRKNDVDAAGYVAAEILDQIGELEKEAGSFTDQYEKTPGQVRRFPRLEQELGRKISDGEIQRMGRLWRGSSASQNPVEELRGKLAGFWLLVVDGKRWSAPNGFKTGRNAAFLLRKIETLLQQAEKGIGTEKDFIRWTTSIGDFLKGGLQVTGGGLSGKLKDFFSLGTVRDMLAALPQANRRPFDDLKQTVDEIQCASDMGVWFLEEPVPVEGRKSPPLEGSLDEIKNRFLQGLRQAKRSLWFSYKQHRGLSRGMSYLTVQFFDAGDIAEIQAGQRALDYIITHVQEAEDPVQIQKAVRELQGQLEADGKIYLAMAAAEMDGVEQLIGVGQTILILLGTNFILKRLPKISAGTVEDIKVIAQPRWGLAKEGGRRAGSAFAYGAYLTAAENAVAAVSGEYRPDGEKLKNWLKDSASTGLSMALTAPFPLLGGRTPSLFRRYFSGGWLRAGGHLVFDTGAEVGEEWLDAFFRAKMDDANAVIGWDQAREIAMVSGVSGAKMGLIKEMIKHGSHADPHGPNPDGDRPSGIYERLPESPGPMSQIGNLARAYGTQNPVIRHAPFLFPMTHPERVRGVFLDSLEKYFLGPLESNPQRPAGSLEKLWRRSAFGSLKTGIRLLYPLYWIASRPFQVAKYSELNSNQEILEAWQQRRKNFADHYQPLETDYLELLQRPNIDFQGKIGWEDYQEMARVQGWDPYLVLARGLKEASLEEVEAVLEEVFGENLDQKVKFLSQYPLHGGHEILRREIAQFSPGHVPLEGFDLYFGIADALESLGMKSQTSLDMRSQWGVHPQAMVFQADPTDLNDSVRLQSLTRTLAYLKDNMAPEEVLVPGLDWFRRPALKKAVLLLWGETGRSDYLPEVLALLKNESDPELLRAAAFVLGQWGKTEALPHLKELTDSPSLLVQAAARRAIGRIEGSRNVEDELSEWLQDPRFGPLNPEVERLGSALGEKPLAEALEIELPVGPPSPDLQKKSPKYRLALAEALVKVSEDYMDPSTRQSTRMSTLKHYPAAARRILLDILLTTEGAVRDRALALLLRVEGRPLKKLLDIMEKPGTEGAAGPILSKTREYLISYLQDEKNPLDIRFKLLGLLKNQLPDETMRKLIDPLLADPQTAPRTAVLLDEYLSGWDEVIQKERKRPNLPEEDPWDGGLMAVVPPLGGVLALLGHQIPAEFNWAYGIGTLMVLGAGLFKKVKGNRQQWLRSIQRNAKVFFRKLGSSKKQKLIKEFEALSGDPKLESVFPMAKITALMHWAEQGLDPILVFHNTGGTVGGMDRILAGKGEGGFPMTILPQFSFPGEKYRHALKQYGLSRHQPGLTLEMTMPLSQFIRWMSNYRDAFGAMAPTNDVFPTVLIPSLMRWAQKHGQVSVLPLPSRRPYWKKEMAHLQKVLKQAGFSQKTLLTPRGPYFEDVLRLGHEEQNLATRQWSQDLVGKREEQMEGYVDAWVDLAWGRLKRKSAPELLEINLQENVEQIAAREKIPLPPYSLLLTVEKRLNELRSAKLQKVERKAQDFSPDPTLAKVVEAWKRGRSLPAEMVYRSFAEIMGVSLEGWLARMLQKQKDPGLHLKDALEMLFGNLNGSLRPLYELEWFRGYRVPQGLPRVVALLQHPSQKVRLSALDTLVNLKPPEAPPVLLQQLHGFLGLKELGSLDRREIIQILNALRQLGLPKGPEAKLLPGYLRALMGFNTAPVMADGPLAPAVVLPTDGEGDVADVIRRAERSIIATHAEATYHFFNVEGGPPYLEAELQHHDADRRLAALEIIYLAELKELLPLVRKSLNDPDRMVRMLVLKILGEHGDRSDVKDIAARLELEEDDEVKAGAAEALLHHKDPASLEPALSSLKREGRGFPGRVQLLQLLGEVKSRENEDMLVNESKSVNGRGKLAAAVALAKMGNFRDSAWAFQGLLGHGNDLLKLQSIREFLALGVTMGKKVLNEIKERGQWLPKALLKLRGPEVFRIYDRFQKGWDRRLQKNWDWLRAEMANGAFIDPQIKDPQWRSFLKSSLSQKGGDLAQYYNLTFQEILEAAAQNQWTPVDTKAELIRLLEADFLDLAKSFNGKMSVLDLQNEIEKAARRGQKLPPWLSETAKKYSESRINTLQLSVRAQDIESAEGTPLEKNQFEGNLELLETLAQQIEDLLKLPKGFLVEREEDAVRINFIPPKILLEGYARHFADRAAQPVPTSQISPLAQMVRMVKKNQRPMLIARTLQELEGRKEVHPYPAWLHDYYHLLSLSDLKPEIREGSLVILDIFEEMGLAHDGNPELGAVLDGLLSNYDPGYADMFAEMRYGTLQDPVLVENFYEKLKDKIQGHSNGPLIKAQFEKVFGDQLGVGSWETQPPPSSSRERPR